MPRGDDTVHAAGSGANGTRRQRREQHGRRELRGPGRSGLARRAFGRLSQYAESVE
jgi:hypothetical protein